MRHRGLVLFSLVGLAAVANASFAFADASGEEPRRRYRKVVVRHVRPAPVPVATVLPPCDDGIKLLLKCVPRTPLPVTKHDVALLNEIATVDRWRARPYRQLFSWD